MIGDAGTCKVTPRIKMVTEFMATSRQAGEVIIEFHRIGGSVKVSAMDARTLIEVSMVGPASASEAQLQQAVIKKLEYVMAKKNKG